jgi:predicted ATPase
MLVLDNCEHVIDAAAGMVEALLHADPAARVIATSREPLKAESASTSTGCRRSPCRRRILRCWRTCCGTARSRWSLRGSRRRTRISYLTRKPIAAICRRLDGIPLAIELAAARASTLRVQELASRLDKPVGREPMAEG